MFIERRLCSIICAYLNGHNYIYTEEKQKALDTESILVFFFLESVFSTSGISWYCVCNKFMCNFTKQKAHVLFIIASYISAQI